VALQRLLHLREQPGLVVGPFGRLQLGEQLLNCMMVL